MTYKRLEVLFSDGGPGIEENLLAEGMRLQRCLWHGKRDFPFLMYADGLKKAAQQPFRSLFGQIPVFDLTKQRLENIHPADRETIQQLVQQTRQGFEQLLKALAVEKYPKARTYIAHLYEHTMTFLEYWLESSQWLPLNINAIESAFSRIANRIKNLGKRWSDQGLLQWLMLVLTKVFRSKLWEQFWSQYMKLNRKMTLTLCQVKYAWL